MTTALTTRTLDSNPGVCLHSECEGYHPQRDMYGLCPTHAVTPHGGDTVQAVREIGRVYPSTLPARRRREFGGPIMLITRHQLDLAEEMLAGIHGQQLSRLIWRDHFPGGKDWQTRMCRYSFPTFMGGVAQAVAQGRYEVIDE